MVVVRNTKGEQWTLTTSTSHPLRTGEWNEPPTFIQLIFFHHQNIKQVDLRDSEDGLKKINLLSLIPTICIHYIYIYIIPSKFNKQWGNIRGCEDGMKYFNKPLNLDLYTCWQLLSSISIYLLSSKYHFWLGHELNHLTSEWTPWTPKSSMHPCKSLTDYRCFQVG